MGPENIIRLHEYDEKIKEQKELLKACLKAFNILPNTAYGANEETYNLASKIEKLLNKK